MDESLREVLRQALTRRLSREQREILMMRRLEGMNWAEVSAVMSLPESVVEAMYQAALERLRGECAGAGKR